MHSSSSSKKRWSDGPATTSKLPLQIPQEMLLEADGSIARIIEIRTLINDMQKLRDDNEISKFFYRRSPIEYNPRWNAKGNRTNAAEKYFFEKLRDLTAELTRYQLNDAKKGQDMFKQEIKHKIYLTPQQIVEKTYGAILGVRGRQQQELEKQTGCKIILCGRGISFRKRMPGEDDGDERPHVKITAPNEESLEKAIEQINFLLGNSQQAIAYREENRRRLAIANGTNERDRYSASRMQLNPNFIPQIWPDDIKKYPPIPQTGAAVEQIQSVPSESPEVSSFVNELRQ